MFFLIKRSIIAFLYHQKIIRPFVYIVWLILVWIISIIAVSIRYHAQTNQVLLPFFAVKVSLLKLQSFKLFVKAMAAKVLSEELEYYNFTQEYYFKQISSNSWIQSMNIEKDIINQIAIFSIGILSDCNNDKCIYEVLIAIANHHHSSVSEKTSDQRERAKRAASNPKLIWFKGWTKSSASEKTSD